MGKILFISAFFLLIIQITTVDGKQKHGKSSKQTYRDKSGKLVEIGNDGEIPADEGILKPTVINKQKGRSLQRSKAGKISNENEVNEILQGISELKIEYGNFGALSILKKDVSFPILMAPIGVTTITDQPLEQAIIPVVGGALFGKGRIIVYASEKLAFSNGAPNPLVINALKWASSGDKSIAVVYDFSLSSDIQTVLDKEKYSITRFKQTDVTSSSVLSPYKLVLMPVLWDLQTSVVEPLQEYVKNGGGLLGTLTSWYREAADLKDHPANKLIGPSGLFFLPVRTTSSQPSGTIDASKDLLRDAHSHLVVEDLPELVKNKDTNKDSETRLLQMSAIIKQCLANTDKVFIPWLQDIQTIISNLSPLNPTLTTPEKGTAFRQFQVDLEWTQFMETDPKDMKPHPGHTNFPGAVKDSAKRVPSFNRTIPLDQRHFNEYEKEKGFESDGAVLRDSDGKADTEVACTAWCSTTMYAPAGEVIEVILHSQDIVSFNLLIGCHTDDLRRFKESWVRYPAISFQKLFQGNTAKASSPFGGLVFVKDVVVKGSLDNVVIEVKGAVATNSYIYNETSLTEWNDNLKNNNDAPWTEFVSERLTFCIPTKNASAVDNPDEVMRYWAKAVDAMSELAGFKPELNFHRIAFDIDISQGFMHSGNPIMGFQHNAMNALDLKIAHDGNGWVFLHELGHNHQKPEYMMDGMTEVTNLIFATYVRNTVINMTMIDANYCNDNNEMSGKIGRYLKLEEGSRFAKFKSEGMCGIADIFFYHLELAYGWEPWKKLFRAYRKMKEDDLPKSDDDKWDTFFVTFSNCVGKNLEQLFNSWAIPLTSEAKGKVAQLPSAEQRADKFAAELKIAGTNLQNDPNELRKRRQQFCLKDIEYCKKKKMTIFKDKKGIRVTMYEAAFGES